MALSKVRVLAVALVVVTASALGVGGAVASASTHSYAAHSRVKAPHKSASARRRTAKSRREANKRREAAKAHRRSHRHHRRHTKRHKGHTAKKKTVAAKRQNGSTGSSAPSATAASTASNKPSIYWGASIGSQLTGQQAPWDMTAISDVASESGKGLSLVHFGTPFASCSSTTASSCTDEPFPTTPMTNIRGYGAIPLLDWSSVADDSNGTSAALPSNLSAVTSGYWDSYIRSFAEAAKAWDHPFFLRFDWEMNGNWFPWSEGVNGNTAGQFVAAWRHVHDIFSQVGATNVSWVWCPNVDFENVFTSLKELYPGNSYVDWTCLDGYNWGSNPAQANGSSFAQTGTNNWQSFDQIFQSTYHEIVNTIAPGKPMIVGEVGSTEDGGSKPAWITNMLSEIPTDYPDIHGLMYFDRYDNNMDWPLETSSSAVAAWRSGIAAGAYVANSYSGLNTSPIPIPTA